VNGFNSFLALKGIRYDDKQEFFQSLEITVLEILSADSESPDKREMEAELAAQYQNGNNFRLKPGHRNYIMNLMLEIEKIDVNDFFAHRNNETIEEEHQIEELKMPSPLKHEYSVAHQTPPNTSSRLIVRRSNSDQQIVVRKAEQNDQEIEQEPEYVFEEEYLTDDTMDSMMKVEYDPIELQSNSKKRKMPTISSPPSGKRRPEQMYNEDFIAKCVNPRRRRVTLNKTYPATDEGTRERFTDLIHQVTFCLNFRDFLF
jgi:hypothetical protein